MYLWVLFVSAQTRLFLNNSYNELQRMEYDARMLREIMGMEYDLQYSNEPKVFEYQNILDNESFLEDDTVMELNQVIDSMGYDVKKKGVAFALKD